MLLTQLLFRGFGVGRLLGGLGGAWLGWTLLFGGLQFWLLIDRSLLRQDQVLGPEYFVIHKPVPLIGLFGTSGIAFTEAEVNELKRQPGVTGVASFQCSQFRAHAAIGGAGGLGSFETELFFEALPDEFLDNLGPDWRWRLGDETIPIMVPRDYLALYNFGFAQSQGLPQFSDTLFSQLRFRVQITGQGKEKTFKARVASFSRRINSILVPAEFLQWANANFGEGTSRTSRLIVQAGTSAASSLVKFFAEKKYQYNTEQLKTAKLGSALRLLLYLVAAFGGVVLILAFWIIALSFQLLIARNQERLQKLIWLGYPPAELAHRYFAFLIILMLAVNLGCWGTLAWGMQRVGGVFNSYGIPMVAVSLGRPLTGMGVLSLIILGLNYGLLRRQIFRLTGRS